MLFITIFITLFSLANSSFFLRESEQTRLINMRQGGLLQRNGSTGVDAINVLRRCVNHGLPSEALVGIGNDNSLAIIFTHSQNYTNYTRVISRCFGWLGHSINIYSINGGTDEDHIRVVGTLGQCMISLTVSMFEDVTRATHNGPDRSTDTLVTALSTTAILLSIPFGHREPPRMITMRQEDLLARNGSAAVDAINVLRCCLNQGLPSDALVGVSGPSLAIVVSFSHSRQLMRCFNRFGYGINFYGRNSPTDIEGIRVVGTLGQSMTSLTVSMFEDVTRATHNGPDRYTDTLATALPTTIIQLSIPTSLVMGVGENHSLFNSLYLRTGKNDRVLSLQQDKYYEYFMARMSFD